MKYYIAGYDVKETVGTGDVDLRTSQSDALDCLNPVQDDYIELYEVTFKLIKKGTVSITTKLTIKE